MNAKSAQTKEIIKERFMKLNESVYQQMMNTEKNNYDPEITLPPYHMMEDMPLKKQYYCMGTGIESTKKEIRRSNDPSVLEKHLINDKQDEAKRLISKSYHASITEISKKADFICSQKTARKVIQSLLQMVGYDDEISIPKVLTDDILECIKKWIPRNTTLYKCCNNPDKLLDYMGKAEMVYTYEFYRIVKQMILMKCENKQEYENRVARLHKNQNLNAVCNAARTLKK